MWRQRKLWEGPNHPWQRERLEQERQLITYYGLKNKKELWKATTIARKIRKYVRYLNAKRAAGFDVSKEEEKFKRRLIRYGLLSEADDLNKALDITAKDILERRLQTIVWRRGLAKTIKQARQFIVHGHIVVGERVVTSPGYLVKIDEEELVNFNEYSPLADPNHPIRAQPTVTKEESSEENIEEAKQEETQQE